MTDSTFFHTLFPYLCFFNFFDYWLFGSRFDFEFWLFHRTTWSLPYVVNSCYFAVSFITVVLPSLTFVTNYLNSSTIVPLYSCASLRFDNLRSGNGCRITSFEGYLWLSAIWLLSFSTSINCISPHFYNLITNLSRPNEHKHQEKTISTS